MGYFRWSSIILLSMLMIHAGAYAKQRVCVVGAGMAGLAAIKLLRDHSHDLDVIAFEKNSDVGGMWIYTDSTDVDEHGLPVHSSLYKNLRTNLPRELMAYPDYLEFEGPENRSYVNHESVLEYLKNYTEHFNLRQNIKFNTLVEKIRPILGDKDWRSTKWSVKTRNLNANVSDETFCDAVLVCNGAWFKPYIPEIPGIESFPGPVIHSHIYRRPEVFENKTVVILGASASGDDISRDLSPHVKTIYLSHRHEKLVKKFPENIIQVRGVISCNGSELLLQDGSTITANAFVFCTGYRREFAFLDESTGIFVEKKDHVRPLYKYIVNVEHPSMGFIGMQHFFVKGTYFYSQVKFFINLLRDKIKLPSYDVMMEDSKTPPPSLPTINGTKVNDPEWDYNANLAKEGGFQPPPSVYEKTMKLYIPMQATCQDYHKYDLKFLPNGDPIFVHRVRDSEVGGMNHFTQGVVTFSWLQIVPSTD